MSRARDLSKLSNPQVFSVDTDFNVGVDSTTPDAKFDVVGVVSATTFYGDGSNLTGIVAGATLAASNGTQRVVVTGQTTGSMTEAATNSGLTYATSTNTLSATTFVGSLLGNATGLQGTPDITVQDVTAETVSVAGTISYEDVTNVNSVGVITANQGVTVPDYGVTVTGVVTATSFSGDGSNLTGLESGVANFVASGAISNGDTVVINTNGTVGIVTRSGSDDPSLGTHSVFEQETTEYTATVYDTTNDKIVVAYRDAGNSNYGTAVVGTVSGSSINFGTPQVFKSASSEHIAATFDSDAGKVVIFWRDQAQGDYGKAIVGTVSGTSITFGNEVTFESAASDFIDATFDTTNNKVVVAYRDGGDSNQGKTRVGTVSGTSISFGTAVTHETGDSRYNAVTFDSTNGKVILAYRDQGDSYYGKSRVGTVSGTSISYGSHNTFSSEATEDISLVHDSVNNKIVVTYLASGDGDKGKSRVGTVSGTTISYDSALIWHANSTQQITSVYDSVNGKIVIGYRDGSNNGYGTAVVGTVSGSSISFSSDLVFESANTWDYSMAFDPDSEKAIISYKDSGNSAYGTSVLIGATSLETNLTTENYLGLAAETIADGQTGKVTIIGGINEGQTGLTTAQTYYVQNGGGLGLSASNPSVVAGTSVSSSKVLVWKS